MAKQAAATRWQGRPLAQELLLLFRMGLRASKFRHWILLSSLFAVGAPAQDLESLDRIRSAVQQFGQTHLPAPGARQRLIVGPLDERLRLPRCPQELSAQAGPGAAMQDRMLVEVGCAAPAPWRIFVPVRIAGVGRAVTLKRPMMAGQTLGAADLNIIEGDTAQFPLGFFDDPAQVAGSTLRLATAGGVVLSNQMLLSAGTIVRGQAVTLLANAQGVAVRMSGRALSDGAVNQRVKVRNDSSGKVVEGIARSQQLVEINP